MYLYELKSHLKTAIIWACSITALAALFLAIYPAVANDAQDFKSLLANYPPTVREMLGINLDYIASLLGFYTMIFSFILLCGTIQAMNLGVSILSKESRERTADFLLVKPVSRFSIVSAKLLAAFTTVLGTDLVFFTAVITIANFVKTEDYNGKLFFMINLTMFFTQIIFLAIGMFVSVFFNKIKNVLPISLGFIFGFYMIGALLAVDENKEALRFISPFKYFDITYIMKHQRFEIPYLILSAAIIIVCIVASYIIYNRKDIHAVS